MHGPICIFWANLSYLTPFSLQVAKDAADAPLAPLTLSVRVVERSAAAVRALLGR